MDREDFLCIWKRHDDAVIYYCQMMMMILEVEGNKSSSSSASAVSKLFCIRKTAVMKELRFDL